MKSDYTTNSCYITHHFLKGWENTLFELRSERVKLYLLIVGTLEGPLVYTVYPLYCGHSHILLIFHEVVCDPKLAFLEVQEGREGYGLSFEELHPGQDCWEISKAPPSPFPIQCWVFVYTALLTMADSRTNIE